MSFNKLKTTHSSSLGEPETAGMGAIENLLGRAYQFVIGHKLLVVRKKRKPAKEFFQIERRATNDELRDLLFSFQGSKANLQDSLK